MDSSGGAARGDRNSIESDGLTRKSRLRAGAIAQESITPLAPDCPRVFMPAHNTVLGAARHLPATSLTVVDLATIIVLSVHSPSGHCPFNPVGSPP